MTEPAASAASAASVTPSAPPPFTPAPAPARVVAWAPIKAEFLLPPTQTAAASTTDAADATEATEANETAVAVESAATTTGKRKPEAAGSWVKRTGAGKAAAPTELCRAVAAGRACTFPRCNRAHDAAAFLAARPADLAGECPFFVAHGSCPFGVACRFIGTHLAADGVSSRVDEARAAANPLPVRVGGLTVEQTRAIERRRVPTPRADAFWSARDRSDAELTAPARAGEIKAVDFRHKTILAPLTTVGHAAFRRICKSLGADITVCEMALAHELQHGKSSEWSLLKRHASEDVFGVQLASGAAQSMAQAIELMRDYVGVSCDYISLNAGCPLDMLCNHGGGAQLSCAPNKLRNMVRGMVAVADVPVEVKVRTGRTEAEPVAHSYLGELRSWGVAAVTLHGRARRTRYTEPANRDYMLQCAALSSVPFNANGDIYSFEDAVDLWRADGHVAGLMIGRAALIKPWIFQEIKERRHIDISANERLELIGQFCRNGLELFGSDARGVENTRRYLCEWLSFAHRYVPVGILERLPSQLHERPAPWRGRSELETLLGSPATADWVKVSNMFLGNAPESFQFAPKHKSQAYEVEG